MQGRGWQAVGLLPHARAAAMTACMRGSLELPLVFEHNTALEICLRVGPPS